MGKILQEKFQTTLPREKEDSHEWVSQKRVRVSKGIDSGNNYLLGTLPPGMDIEDAEIADIRVQNEVHLSGTTDISMDTNSESLRKGYTRRGMLGTDDMYTNEHVDLFYSDVTVDGDTGFLERGNLLDRS